MRLRVAGMLGIPEGGDEFNLVDDPRILLSAAEALCREFSGREWAFTFSRAFHDKSSVAVDGNVQRPIFLF